LRASPLELLDDELFDDSEPFDTLNGSMPPDSDAWERDWWECPRCTFATNQGAVCEICGAPRAAAGLATSTPADLGDAAFWPSLEAAAEPSWAHCDASSIASSWLEVADPRDLYEEGAGSDSDIMVVTAPAASGGNAEPRAPVSWAVRAAAGPSKGCRVAPRAAVPPLTRQGPRRVPASVPEEEEELDGCLENLESRRLCGTSRGGRQYRRSVRRAR